MFSTAFGRRSAGRGFRGHDTELHADARAARPWESIPFKMHEQWLNGDAPGAQAAADIARVSITSSFTDQTKA